jgi:hypothetical protein
MAKPQQKRKAETPVPEKKVVAPPPSKPRREVVF